MLSNNIIYLHKSGFVIARISMIGVYKVFACNQLPDDCGRIIPTIFDTREQAREWLGVFNVH